MSSVDTESIAIYTTDKFKDKADRYLSQSTAHELLRGYSANVYRERSPYNPEMYDNTTFILRYNEHSVDVIVRVLSEEEVLAITQKSFHGKDYSGSEFYERVGSGLPSCIRHAINSGELN